MVYPVEIPDARLKTGALLAAAMLALILSLAAFVQTLNTTAIEPDQLVHINSDPVESLVRLPGIGISTADSIVDYRNASQQTLPFRNIGELRKVRGIGEQKAALIEPYVSFE